MWIRRSLNNDLEGFTIYFSCAWIMLIKAPWEGCRKSLKVFFYQSHSNPLQWLPKYWPDKAYAKSSQNCYYPPDCIDMFFIGKKLKHWTNPWIQPWEMEKLYSSLWFIDHNIYFIFIHVNNGTSSKYVGILGRCVQSRKRPLWKFF
jgi:hypothetical protein